MTPSPDPRLVIQPPRAVLRPFVRRFMVVESMAPRDDVHLPEPGAVAAFSFRGDCRLNDDNRAPRSAISGLWHTARRHWHSADHAVVIVSFTPVGAAAFLRPSIEAFGNATVDLEDVPDRPDELERLHARLNAAGGDAERIRLVENLLLARCDNARVDTLVAAAVGMVEQFHGNIRIGDLARRVGLSQSALERRFRRRVGASPRRFASLVRLQNVLRLRRNGADWTTTAHAAGYSDQPHFINEFKRMTGVAPGSFFARAPLD